MSFITKRVTLTVELEIEIETEDQQVCNVMIGNPQDINEAITAIIERDWQGQLEADAVDAAASMADIDLAA